MKYNLNEFRSPGSKIFSGRDKGIEARKKLKLDQADLSNEKITIAIPMDTWSINSSFFGGLFEESVIKFGKDKFIDKYIFVMEDGTELSQELRDNIDEGIFDAANIL